MNKHITNVISRVFGVIASYKFPTFLQNLINKSYIFFMNLDMKEYESVETFKTLNELFTRELKNKREIQGDKYDFISPCDGLISEQGAIEFNKALQIKGHPYNVKKLLGEYVCKKDKEKLSSGYFINFYLSPKDYHRFHSPCDMRVLRLIHITGKLYPVNFTWLRKIDSLFCENERVILVCENMQKQRFYMIFVGALNVGKIALIFENRIQTNASEKSENFYDYENVVLKKGDELGRFEMGSTIVVLFEDASVWLQRKNEKVRFGEIVASF